MESGYVNVTGQKKSSNKSKQILFKGSFFCQTWKRRKTMAPPEVIFPCVQMTTAQWAPTAQW